MEDVQRRPSAAVRVATRVAACIAFAVLLLIVCTGAIHERGMAVDDAFISYRYADHLAHGLGLRWNPDAAPNEGYTNFLYVLAVAGLDLAGVPPPSGGLIVGVAAAVAMIVLLAVVAQGHGAASLLSTGIVLLLLGREETRVHASRGLETMLFCVLVGLQLLLAGVATAPARSMRRSLLLGAVSALLCMCRPDGLLIAAVTWAVVVGARWSRSVSPRRIGTDVIAGLGLFAFVMAAYVGWKWSYFGYVLPNSFYAKATAAGWPGVGPTLAFLRAYALAAGAAWAICAIHGVVTMRERLRRRSEPADWRPLIASIASVAWCAYSLKIIHEMGYSHRFLQPVVPLAAFGACFAIGDFERKGWFRGRAAFAALAAGVVAVGLLTPNLVREAGSLRGPPPVDNYVSSFRRLGEAIRDIASNRPTTLVCNHAGATPYFAGVHHVDPTGLVDDGFCVRSSKVERWRYRLKVRPDVISSHLFPASPGSMNLEEDRRAMSSTYVTKWCLGAKDDADLGAKHDASTRDLATRESEMFVSMSFFRDHCTLVGEIRLPAGRWREFLYVWNDSPYRDEFIAKLARVVDIPANAVSFN